MQELIISSLPGRIQIGSNSARKEDWILRNYGQAGAKVMELDVADVNSVYENLSFFRFQEAK